MRKKKVIKRRAVKPDRKFSSQVVSRLINKVMKCGEKRKAAKIVYKAAQMIEKNTSSSFLTFLEEALINIKPDLELKSRKIGGAKYRIPTKVGEWRALFLAICWLVESAQGEKTTTPMFQRLAEEIVSAYNKTGKAFHKRETIHKEAMGNMAFAFSLNK